MDFNIEKPTKSTEEMTSLLANELYLQIREKGDIDKAFKQQLSSEHDWESYLLVKKELDRIHSEISNAELTTKQELIDSLTSELLNIETIVDDYIKYDCDGYKADRTWEEFVEYNTKEEVM